MQSWYGSMSQQRAKSSFEVATDRAQKFACWRRVSLRLPPLTPAQNMVTFVYWQKPEERVRTMKACGATQSPLPLYPFLPPIPTPLRSFAASTPHALASLGGYPPLQAHGCLRRVTGVSWCVAAPARQAGSAVQKLKLDPPSYCSQLGEAALPPGGQTPAHNQAQHLPGG